ncbi:MAG TPA: OmpA family protein [Thermoanaerobaculia bacterium]|nr:OmpA family protein [Thermoanaerobaculia bacterium]
MKAKRSALLVLLFLLAGASAFAQIAPNNQGDIGLFTMPTADNPRAGQLTLGLYGWLERLVAGELSTDADHKTRLYNHWAAEGSVGLGLTDRWSIFASAGWELRESRGGWRGGVVNGLTFFDPFEVDEGRKVRVGTKVNFISEADSDLRVGIFLAGHIPVSNSSIRQDEQFFVADQINSRRADWEWGAVLTKGVFTAMGSYTLAGRHDEDLRTSNRLRFGVGVDLPIVPFFHLIGELDRNILDGGDFPEEDYSLVYAGGRLWLGHTGIAVSAALNANLDQIVQAGWGPAPIGGLVGITYAAWPPPPPPPVVVPPPPPPPVVEEAPGPPPPPPPAPRTTTDEIYFDSGSARLTNIAKAILDGVALRMKNDLNSTAVISGYSDNVGSEQSNLDISRRRAAAAKEYLVTRHGIDPSRITTEGKGSAEPAYDNSTPEGRAKNRRALIVVTLVSGT